MTSLTAYTSYADAQAHFSSARLWELFDGDRERLNIAHECIDRHVDGDRTARSIVVHADGARRDPELSPDRRVTRRASPTGWRRRASRRATGSRSCSSRRCAFYAALFGAMKARRHRGAAVHPVRPRRRAAARRRLHAASCSSPMPRRRDRRADRRARVVVADDACWPSSAPSRRYEHATRADDLAIFQYTSGTTRELPEAVKHTHRAIVTLMVAALYGTGMRPGDRFFCPSSPAWGHGLWHGTLAPLALGVTTGAYAGKFDAVRLLQALQDYRVTNISAAATHYRMMRNSGARRRSPLLPSRSSPSPASRSTARRRRSSRRPSACRCAACTARPRSASILVNYPGAADFVVKPGSLGKPVPGRAASRCRTPTASRCPPGVMGEIKVWRRDALDRRPRTSAASTRTATSSTAAAPTTSSSRPAGR